jgi:anaerobic magnesium-protoporphyrin IX monomethyl ester cyclase
MQHKICFIIPDSIFLLDARVFPFLGVLGIASMLEKHGHIVDVIDLSGVKNWEDVLTEYLQSNKQVQIGITATSPQMPMAYKISRFIKKNFGNKIILGGPHPSLSNAGKKIETKRGIVNGRAFNDIESLKKDFDVLVYGEGEVAIFDALVIDQGEIDADEKHSSLFISKEKLDALPLPARHLVDLKSYKYSIDARPATSFISELGCYFKCAFCAGRNTSFLRFVRQKSPQNIKDELSQLYKTYGFTAFNDYSDEINVPKNFLDYTQALIELQDQLGVDFRFRAFIKAELFTEQQAKALYDAGFRTLLCGFESGDDKILRNIKKIATKEDNTRVVEICNKFNLKIKALMSIGHCGESHETIENTRSWLVETKPDDFDVTVITPYCGSPYFDEAVRHSKDKDVWVYEDQKSGDRLYQKSVNYESEIHSYKGIPGEYVSYCWTDYISGEDLVKTRDEVEQDVRNKLGIPFNPSSAARQYEKSMGQSNLPDWVFRSTETHKEPEMITHLPTKRALKVIK